MMPDQSYKNVKEYLAIQERNNTRVNFDQSRTAEQKLVKVLRKLRTIIIKILRRPNHFYPTNHPTTILDGLDDIRIGLLKG